MTKRHENALFIQEGACNPRAQHNKALCERARDLLAQVETKLTTKMREGDEVGYDQLAYEVAKEVSGARLRLVNGLAQLLRRKLPDEPALPLRTTEEVRARPSSAVSREDRTPIPDVDIDFYRDVTPEQVAALHHKWRQDDQGMSFPAFLGTVQPGSDCIMVKWCNMWLGIEKDGYTHS